ncbi:MAG: hypothetical protein L3J41_09910, partial [Melioribacteraceae bacterium]|nr:hypothetical protein [Melioribacteraceae bacterium]
MKILKQIKKLSFLFLMLTFVSASSFAQTYVSATDGDDGVAGDGTMLKPYATITNGITNTAAGGTLIVEPGTYAAATTTVTKALTIRAEDFGSNGGTAVIMNDLVLNMATSTDVLSFGATGMPFNVDDLTLTDGVMNIATANVVISSGSTITRADGTLNVNPTVTNVFVSYVATAGDITAGGELPSDLGTGTLTVNIGAANTLTVGSAVEAATVTVTTGDVDFADVISAGVVGIAAGTVSFTNLTSDGNVTVTSGNTSVTGTLTLTDVSITNNGTGDVTLGNVAVTFGSNIANTINNAGNGNLTINGTLSFVHDGFVAVSTYTGSVDNAGTGTVTLAQGFTKTEPTATELLQISLNNGAAGKLIANGVVSAYNVTQAAAAGTVTLTGGTADNAVNVGAAGTLDLASNFTIAGAVAHTNSGTIKVNANTLSFTGAGATLVGAGDVISATAATVGSGTVDFTKAITVAQAELPKVMVSGTAGKVTLGSAVNVYGDFVLASPVAGALTDAGNNLHVYGNFTRNDNTLGNVAATGTLTMNGAGVAIITAGTQLALNNLVIDKDALATTVSLSASLIINSNFTITKGTVELSTYHIRMQGGGTVTNGSGGYNSTGGYLIVESATNLAGAAVYSNIDIRGTNTATVTAAILKFSGILHITDGVLAVGANTFTFVDDLITTPDVYIHTDGPGTMTIAGGTVNTESATVFYNLTYTGVGNAVAGAEWIAVGINNLSISTGGAVPASNTITRAVASTLEGVLTVDSKQTLTGAFLITLDGDNKTHSIVGKVLSGSIDVTGKTVAINGSTATTADAEIPTLLVSTASGETFSSDNLKLITGNLTITNGSADVNMNTTTANITGNVNLTDGALDLNMASTTSTHGGNLVVTKGDVVYTRGSVAAQQIIGGAVTLTDGTLSLGSDVSVTGVTTQVAGDLMLGAFDYTAKTANYTRTGAGSLTGTGNLVVGTITLTPGTTFTVPNLVLDGNTTIGAAMEVTNSLTHTTGNVNYANLTFSGNTYLYESTAGTIAGAFTLSGAAVVATFEQDVAIPTLTINSTGSVEFKSDGATARTITVGTSFTQTKGDLALGINTLAVSTSFTNTAGNMTQS